MTRKLYMENSYLKEVEAKIISKEYINNKYHIKLDKTIFYPNLVGGQPRDLGLLNGQEVTAVYEDGNDIGHIVKEDIDKTRVKLSIDWDHRFDMMQQHSGQHLLSSCFHRLMDADTVGFHIGRDYIYIDLDLDNLDEEDASRAEFLANKIIQSNFQIKSYFVSQEEAKRLPLKDIPFTEGDLRIIEIDNIDYDPCGGTHVGYTGEIGLIKIRRWYRSKGNVRIEFVCGNRALEDYGRKTRYVKEIGLLLSSKDKDIVYKTKSLYYQKENLEKENRSLKEELNKYRGQAYLAEAKNIGGINYLIKSLEGLDLKEVNATAHSLNDKERLVQIYGISNEESSQFLISRSNDLDLDLKDIFNIVKKERQIKGGGSSQMIQGGVPKEELEGLIKEFFDEIRDYYKK